MSVARVLSIITFGVSTAMPVLAQVQPSGSPRNTDSSAIRLGAVEVLSSPTGIGRARTLTSLSSEMIKVSTVPGTSALKAVEKLPGVNFQSADPWGTYEWSNRVTIRGFQPGQVGQTFDGIPLGDMSYGNHNGLGIGRAVDPDNLEGASVAQGSGALATSSNNNLGGVIQYLSSDAANTQRLQLRQMAGEAAALRTYGRYDLGLRTSGGVGYKGYVSFSRIDNDKWKGSGVRYSPVSNALIGDRGGIAGVGETYQDMVNAKLVFLRGAHTLTAFYDLADRKEADYTDLSLARFNASGRDWDQFSDWSVARQFANSSTPDEAYFHSAIGARRDHLAYLAADMGFSRARVVVTPYMHTNVGNGDWHAPSYGSTWSPDSIYFRQTQYDNSRMGVNARLSTSFGANELEAGAWLEQNESNIRRVGWRLQNFTAGPEVNFNNVLRLFFDRTGTLTSTMAYVQNTTTLMGGDLRLIYGAKFLHVGAEFVNNGLTIPSAATAPDVSRPSLSVPTEGGILPQLGAVLRLGDTEEVFANVSQNVNAYPYSPQSGVYNTNPAAFQLFKDQTKPEKALTAEVGVRTRRNKLEASLSLYNVDYTNRLIGVSRCPLTATCVSTFANVGDVAMRGAEGMTVVSLTREVRWMTSASFTDATIQDDYDSDATTVVPSKGKKVVDVPRVLLSSGLQYDNSKLFVNTNVRHVGERYFTILNDLSVPAYTVVDGGVGYRLGAMGGMKALTLQLNVANLLDEKYIATMGTNGFTVSGDNQTLMAGAKRLVFLTLGAAF